ncbi:MAG: tetratricopeptide repeat protein [Candidatus Rokuibacteriota bacterium]
MATADEVRQLEARLTREPSSQAYAALAEAYRRAGRVDEAVSLCREGLERCPMYSTARFILAKALLDRGDVAAARSELEQFLQSEPDHEPALRLVGECALRLADPAGALRHLRRLVSLDPEDRSLQGPLRALELAVGARAPGAEAGGLWPLLGDDTFATVTFGDLCMAQGLTDEATAVFGRIVVRVPENEIARQRLAELGRARGQARRPRG